MNAAALDGFRQIATDMGINPWPETESRETMFSVEYQARGGDWGRVRVLATSATEAERKVAGAEFAHRTQPMAKATHKMDDAGQMVRL